MKKNTAYTIGSLVILLICAFCFVILPAMTGSGQAAAKLPPFGKYDGKAISMEEGSDMKNFAANYSRMFQQYGQQLDDTTYFYILNSAFNSTATKYAYQDSVEDSGYVVTDAAIRRGMKPFFYDENGKYSSKLYRQTPDNTKQEIMASVEDNLYTTRFYDDNFGSSSDIVGTDALYGLKESNAELDFLKGFNENQRGFNLAYFPLEEYPAEEVIKYGKANSDKFVKYDMSVITVEDETVASTVVRRLANNEITFEDAVTEYSTKYYGDTEGAIDGGFKYQIEDMLSNKEDISKIAALGDKAVSEAIKTTTGYSIFKNNGAAVNPDFESTEITEVVSDYLNTYEATMIEDYFTSKADEFVAEAKKSDFTSASSALSVANLEIAPFPLNYGNTAVAGSLVSAESVLANSNSNEQFLKTAFSLKMNEYSKPFVMNRNVVVLQYTTAPESTEEYVFDANELRGYDELAAQSFVLNSDKLENNFTSVYFDNLMSK